jgi:bacteriophage N4 adsorption protein B
VPGLSLSTIGLIDDRLAAVSAAILLPLALYILISGLDDLLADLAWLRVRNRLQPAIAPIPGPEPLIALFIPCWRESAVIGSMLEHNLAAIAWSRYEVFIGVYPNDPDTADAVRQVQKTHRRVHLAFVPHDGPTSKPDCLNWIYQQMLLHEENLGCRFDLVLVHDAEDVIHPDALARLAAASAHAGMVQLPVLPLPTPASHWTHGVYCDDFAESQGKDLATRNALGAFVPSCGVGTSFRRDAIDLLASTEDNRLFQPDALTEDYDIGLRLHRLGVPQTFVPLEFRNNAPLATREFFPHRSNPAIRQRTRWVTGNALQSWQRHGWPGPWINRWYLWRDRKGLWGNPLSLLCNIILLYGASSWALNTLHGSPWPLLRHVHYWPGAETLLLITTALFAARLAFRTAACARVYGWLFAAGVPLRMLWGNWINCAATLRALFQFTAASIARRPLVWVKTEHAYPSRGALLRHKRRLGDILVESGFCSRADIELAACSTFPGRLGERLLALDILREDQLYSALALQLTLPFIHLAPATVNSTTARSLPVSLIEQFAIIPFRADSGALLIAGPEFPPDALLSEIRRFTSLQPRFHLITPSNFRALRPLPRVRHATAGT